MRALSSNTLLLLLSAATANAALLSTVSLDVPTTTTSVPECTASSSTGSGAFFDVKPDMAVAPNDSKSSKAYVTKDYYSRGYDYHKNFTLNICASVVDPVSDVVDVDSNRWANVSAYYTSGGRVYSIGEESMNLTSRGRKLVLQYVNGSPCGPGTENELFPRDMTSALNEPVSFADVNAEKPAVRRKSTIISFQCEKDPGLASTAISFVGTDPDECAYFFEARSVHACAHAEPHKPGSVGPASIFGLILSIAVLVYILGGIFYNRTVAHSRGWRQLPNYSLWAGIWSSICDFVVIMWASCTRRLFRRERGYNQLSTSPSTRSRNAEAENRLIDQLDEVWED